jgi:predicted transcriptional regulator
MGTCRRLREAHRSQEMIQLFFEVNFPDNKIVLNDDQADYLERELELLSSLHTENRPMHSWQEFLASYELLKYRKGGEPRMREVADFMGLKDRRIRENTWLETVRNKGYKVGFAPRILESSRTKKRIRNAYKKVGKDKMIIFAKDIAKEVGISQSAAADYLSELNLEYAGRGGGRKKYYETVFLKAYDELRGELPPTREEIVKLTGLSKSYVQKACKRLDLPYTRDYNMNKRNLLSAIRGLESEGVRVEEMGDKTLVRVLEERGTRIPRSILQRFRRQLEDEHVISLRKRRALSSSKDIMKKVSDQGLNYFRVRGAVERLVSGNEIYETQVGETHEESMKYISFIQENIGPLCDRMRLEHPGKSLKLFADRKNECYFLKFA